MHHLPPSRRCVLRVATTLCFTFLYLLSLVLSFLVYFRVLTICHKGDTLCSFDQGTTSGLLCTRKRSVGEAPRCFFLDKVYLPVGVSSSCAMVVMLIGECIVSCSPGASPLVYIHYSMNTFFMFSLFGIQFTNNRPLCHFSFSLGLSSAGVAQLPPCFFKLFDETVQTFAVFSSYMYLLDGDDNCMLSVLRVTSTLTLGKVAENCQAVAAGVFTLLGYALWVFFKTRVLSFFICLVVLRTCCVLDVSVL